MGLPPLKKLTIARETSVSSAPNLLLVLHATIESFSDWRPIFTIPGSTEFSQLTQLNIVACDRAASFNILSNMPQLMPNVKRVTITQQDYGYTLIVPRTADLTSCVQLEYLELAVGLTRNDRVVFPPNLIVLRLGKMAGGFLGALDSPPLPRLKELAFAAEEADWCSNLHRLLKSDGVSPSLTHVLQNLNADRTQDSNEMSNLEKLTLQGASFYFCPVSGFISHESMPRLRELEVLSFVAATECNDLSLASIGPAFPKLRELDISETDVTGVGVKDLVHSGHIHKLILNDCRKLGIDAVEWARSHGVEVKYKMKNAEGRGKKVRY
jgi:hypothetical protein